MTSALRRQSTMSVAVTVVASTVLATLVLLPAAAAAQESRSAALATELTKLLDEKKLDSIAANTADQYIGALYFPGSQLLVVRAKAQAARMNALLQQKQYRDVYMDLNGVPDTASKVLIMDLGANGLRFKRESNQPFDTVDAAGKSVAFDGDWGKAKISESDYTKAFSTYDTEYAAMLEALIAAAKK